MGDVKRCPNCDGYGYTSMVAPTSTNFTYRRDDCHVCKSIGLVNRSVFIAYTNEPELQPWRR